MIPKKMQQKFHIKYKIMMPIASQQKAQNVKMKMQSANVN
jgi:hypothetical protein